MKKKLLGLLLCLAIVFSLSSCVAEKSKPAESSAAPSGVATDAPIVEVTDSPAETNAPENPVDAEDIDNPLMTAAFKTAPVLNGSGTEKIGDRGYIEITKEDLKSVTEEQYRTFIEKCVSGAGYNWVSIICDDGTGLSISNPSVSVYGELNDEGMITKTLGGIYDMDGGYQYKEAE